MTDADIEAIIVKAEGWARTERIRRVTSRLRTISAGGAVVPADWRTAAEPSLNCAGDV